MQPFDETLPRADLGRAAAVKPSLVRGLQILFRHWWVVFSFCAVTVALVMTASYVLPPIYGATAKLLLIHGNEQLPIFTLSSTVTDRAASIQLQTEDVLSEMELIQSRPIVERVVDRIGLDRRQSIDLGDGPKPAAEPPKGLLGAWTRANEWIKETLISLDLVTVVDDRERVINALQRGLKLKPIRSSNVFTVYYADNNPKLATLVVNTLIEEYLAYRRDVYKPVGVVDHFREKLEQQKNDLKAAKERLRDYEDKFNIANLEVEIETTLRLYEEAKKGGPFNQQVDQYSRRLATLRAAAPVIKDLRFEAENSQGLYERYAQKYEEVSSNAELTDAKFANVRLIEPATVDWQPTFPHRLLNLFLSVFVGLLGGVGLAFVMNFFSGKLNTVEDVEAAGIPALGSVPRLRRWGRRRPAFSAGQLRTFALIVEQVRGTRARSGFVLTGTSPRVGCSTMAVALAVGLSRNTERRVLVVDADWRVPRLHQLLPAAGKPADPPPLDSQKATATQSPPNTIRPTGIANLDILSARFDAPDQLDPSSLQALLNGSAEHYDFIVVDTPPLFASATALALAKEMADWSAILVVEAGRTSAQVARRAVELLQRQGIVLLGAVLNKREDSVPSFLYRRL